MIMRNVLLLLSLLVFILCGCADHIETPVKTDMIPGAPEIPRDIQTRVSDGEIEITWSVNNPALVRQFIIYRGDTTDTAPTVIDSTAASSYVDGSVRNNIRYIYQIATHGTNDLVSKRSEPVSATAALFSISISNGNKYTSSANVVVNVAAHSSTRYILLANDSMFTETNWLKYKSENTWELERGDGVRWVYARFRDYEGNETSGFFADEIILDTKAIIDSVTENSAGMILTAGNVLHLALYAGELDGEAAVEIPGVGTLTLYDDGSAGDATAADGIYELDWVISGAVDIVDQFARGHFIDPAGNQAEERSSATAINIANAPVAAVLSAYAISETEIELVWTRSDALDFSNYLLFRGDSPDLDTSATLLRNETNIGATNYTDTGLEPNSSYYYVIYTMDKSGLSSKSNVYTVRTEENQQPEPVNLSAYAVSESEIELVWTRSEATDFACYRLFRGNSSDVDSTSTFLKNENIVGNTGYTDRDLEPATNYYYIVYTLDRSGLSSASNWFVAATDTNRAPAAVLLFVSEQNADNITLGWTKNSDTDFESYRIYRSTIPSVQLLDDNLKGVVTSQNITSFTDGDPESGNNYYVVVVFDKFGAHSGPSNEVKGINP